MKTILKLLEIPLHVCVPQKQKLTLTNSFTYEHLRNKQVEMRGTGEAEIPLPV